MFDDIGAVNDEGRRRRQAETGLLTFALTGGFGVVVGMLVTLTPKLADPPRDPIVLGPLVEPEEVIVAAVAPPPPRAGRRDGTDRADASSDDPIEPVPTPEIFEDPTIVRSNSEPKGDPNGVINGRDDGIVGGTNHGDCPPNKTCGSTGSGTVRSLRPRLKWPVEPIYPHEARTLGIPVQTCDVRVDVNRKGRAEAIHISGCPPVFHEETRRAMARSRWHKFDAPLGTVAQFTVRVTFHLHGPD